MNTPNNSIRSEGRTVEEAVNEALLHLGARRDEVEIEVIEEGKSGLFGVLGRKQACVEVRRKAHKRGRRRRGGRGRRKPSQAATAEGAAVPQQSRKDQPAARSGEQRRPRGDQRTRGRRDGSQEEPSRGRERQNRPPRSETPAAKGRAEDQARERSPRVEREREARSRPEHDRPERDRPERDRPERERPARTRPPRSRSRSRNSEHTRDRQEQPSPRKDGTMEQRHQAPKTKPAASVENHAALSGEPLAAAGFAERLPSATVDKAHEVIQNCAEALMNKIGFFCRVDVADGDDEYRNVRIVTDADSADAIAGRRNSTITAIQHLVDRMSTRITGEAIHVNVDINNYRQRRDGRLALLAKDAMSRVKKSSEPEHLPAMNARERRIVHLEVAEIDGLTTITEGLDRDRHVVIKLEDAT